MAPPLNAAPTASPLALAFHALLNGLHLALVFFPIILYFITPAAARPWLKYAFPIYILIPLHWPLFDNQCLFTIASIKTGALEDKGHDASFSDTYLKWLYKPLIEVAGHQYNPQTLDKAIYIHWAINYILLSIYTFHYVYPGKC